MSMLIENIPPHLRNSIESLDLPIYIDIDEDECRPPARLALGDTLMMLGLLRNRSRAVRLYFDPGPSRELVQAFPLVRELLPPDDRPTRVGLHQLPGGRTGRPFTWVSKTVHRLAVPVLPVDRIKANPVGAHSLFYRLPVNDDLPGLAVDQSCGSAMQGLLARDRPTLVIYPFNPGRMNTIWQDPAWWVGLVRLLRKRFSIVAVGGEEYGDLRDEADVCLSWKDPLSTLPNLAWLLSRAEAFAGRDGGISHMAAAVVRTRLTVWDAMSSYRLWATRSGHHLLWSNPYLLRYPQTARITQEDVKHLVRSVQLIGPDGESRQLEIPREGFEETARKLFGSVQDMVATVYAQRQEEAEKASVRAWFDRTELRAQVNQASLGFAAQALCREIPPDTNWVVPDHQ
jgi:hypothetical protein